jgi:uncharacterized protein (TIGR03435 family)
MMTTINGVLLAAGSSLAWLIVVKGTVVAALGLATTWLARRSRAAVRHAFLAVTFGAMLLLPIASIVAPPVHIAMPVAEVSQEAWPLVVNTTAPISPVITAADDGVAPAAPQPSAMFSVSILLLAGWIVGTAVFLVPMITGLWQIRSLRRSGLPWLAGQSITETLALDAGIHRRVEVLLHAALPGPITCGVLHPAIVLPQDAVSWAREDLSRAIVHELEHIRRGDSATRCLARATCALYWFHPLAWIAWRKLVLEAERSCDDAVLRRSEATAYADQLVGLAKRRPTVQRSPLLAMASPSDLATRVRAVLDARQQRGRAGAFSLGLATAAAIVLVLSMSSLILVAMPRGVTLMQTVTPPQFDAASRKPIDPEVHGEPLAQSVPVDRTVSSAPATAVAFAQPPARPAGTAPGTPKFDAASVRIVDTKGDGRGRAGSSGGPGTSDPGRFSYPAATMLGLLMKAFGAESGQILGAAVQPRVGANLYEVIATMPPDTTKEQFQAMLQNLLVERFHLAVHHETRNFPAYELVLDKGGPKMKEATHVADDSPAPAGPVTLVLHSGMGDIKMKEQTTEELAKQLGMELVNAQRIATQVMNSPTPRVMDKTGLTGKYTFTLEFSLPGPPGFTPEPNSPAADLPDLLVALREQLGLRLNQTAGVPVDVIVVDTVDKVPVAN